MDQALKLHQARLAIFEEFPPNMPVDDEQPYRDTGGTDAFFPLKRRTIGASSK
jgi:hypothetical protein